MLGVGGSSDIWFGTETEYSTSLRSGHHPLPLNDLQTRGLIRLILFYVAEIGGGRPGRWATWIDQKGPSESAGETARVLPWTDAVVTANQSRLYMDPLGLLESTTPGTRNVLALAAYQRANDQLVAAAARRATTKL